MRRKKRRRKEAKARQRSRAMTQPSTGRPGSKAVWRKLSAGEAEAEAAEGRPDRPTSSTLDGGEATRCAALAEPVSSEVAEAADRRPIRLTPDPDPATPEGEARAGGGDSEAREGPTGAGGALGE
jgi:hypothetical protein